MRPIDIARRLGISTTTLRKYEEAGLVPPVSRSGSGYRKYTGEHLAYFICIREMLPGFNLTIIAEVLKKVMAHKIDSAYWMVNQAQVDLRQEKIIAENIIKHLFDRKDFKIKGKKDIYTIHDISQETGVPVTTIRYWDKVGLISAPRNIGNNYRVFTSDHMRQVLAIYALKLSAQSNGHRARRRAYFVDQVKQEIKDFNYHDQSKIKEMVNEITRYLDKLNGLQMKGISALNHLWVQVETKSFQDPK